MPPLAQQLSDLPPGSPSSPLPLRQASHPHLPAHLAPAAAGDAAERRVLVSSWVPQTAVLVHPSVAMFVSHVGLGSLYEGLSAGKRLLAMPFFADQVRC